MEKNTNTPTEEQSLLDDADDFIMTALNSFWHQANTALERKDLGDIERKNYEKEKQKAKLLMDELEANGLPYKQENKLLKEQVEKVNRLLHDLTPQGSEFYNDPEYCAKWIRENRTETHYTTVNIIAKLKDRVKVLEDALQPLAELDLEGVNTSMDGNVVYQRNKTYINVGDVFKAKAALKQQ